MARTNTRVFSGNQILVRLDGKTIGIVQNLRATDDFAHEPASGIGDAEVQEYVPTMARHTLNVSMMALRLKSLLSADIASENAEEALQGRVFDIEAYDKKTGTLLKKYLDCSYVSGDFEINKHAITIHNAVFNALSTTSTFVTTS